MTTPNRPPGAIRIVVVDDHDLFRQGLIELLRTIDDFDVVGEGATGDDAIAVSAELKPDMVLLDVAMPGPDPTVTVQAIRSSSPATRVLIVTTFDEPHHVHELIHAGAAGYLLKTATIHEVAAAIHSISRSDTMVHVSVSRQAFAGLTRPAPATGDTLSDRETSVLRLLADAKSNHDIGRTLNISDATVKRHLTNIYTKLGATSRLDALVTARRTGLIHD